MTIRSVDYSAVAEGVYAFAASADPLAGPVKEALGVIDDALDTWGCVFRFSFVPRAEILSFSFVRLTSVQTGPHLAKLQRGQRLYVVLFFPSHSQLSLVRRRAEAHIAHLQAQCSSTSSPPPSGGAQHPQPASPSPQCTSPCPRRSPSSRRSSTPPRARTPSTSSTARPHPYPCPCRCPSRRSRPQGR